MGAHSVYGHKDLVGGHPRRVAVVTGSDSWSTSSELFSPKLWTDLHEQMSDGNISIEESASRMNDVWVSGQLSRHGIEKFVIPCRQESQTVEKSSERKKQNLETGVRQRQELNQRVMKFFRDDWVPEEIM